VPVGELHRAHRLPVALGIGHTEGAPGALLEVTPLLVPDENDRPPVEAADPAHDRGVIGPGAVSVQLDEVLQQTFDVVERIRPILVPRELDLLPDLLVGRLGLDAGELPLEPLQLARELRPSEQVEAAELAQPLAQPELRLTRHV
jgi:hypothetical protein